VQRKWQKQRSCAAIVVRGLLPVNFFHGVAKFWLQTKVDAEFPGLDLNIGNQAQPRKFLLHIFILREAASN
jgi:hypothetical protein